MSVTATPSTLFGKLRNVYWPLPVGLAFLGIIGVMMIYSASGGVWDQGALRHLIRLLAGFGIMIVIALTSIRIWFMLAYPAYLIALVLLICVEFFGVSVNGSQRWLEIFGMRLQPSELMKAALVLALARFYHELPFWRVSKPMGLFGALFIISWPVVLIILQPDLGTSLLLMATGVGMMFLAGVRWRIFTSAIIAMIIAIPIAYRYVLKDYQRSRILTFLNPERDPTGASYHIIQSKIALGSGGVSGKGFLQGSQASLKYVPENRTDFIFTVIGEEFGLVGGVGTIVLYAILMAICIYLAMQCRTIFARMMILGLTITFALYVFINLAMVTGLAPVVGVPLPLISYGGTVMLTVFAGFGLILSAVLHNDEKLPRGRGLIL